LNGFFLQGVFSFGGFKFLKESVKIHKYPQGAMSMLKQIDKRGKLLIKLLCDECHWVKWLKPNRIHKYPECPNCHGKRHEETYQLTEEEVKEVKKELKETFKNPQEIEITIEDIVGRVDPQAETERIVKRTQRNLSKFDK
jgi:hypothetical protein